MLYVLTYTVCCCFLFLAVVLMYSLRCARFIGQKNKCNTKNTNRRPHTNPLDYFLRFIPRLFFNIQSSDSDQRKLILMFCEVYEFVSLEIQTFLTKEVQFFNDNRDISTGVRLDPTW